MSPSKMVKSHSECCGKVIKAWSCHKPLVMFNLLIMKFIHRTTVHTHYNVCTMN